MLAQNVHTSPQPLGKMGHQISHFRSYFQKMKSIFMFRRWPFSLTLKEFLKNSNPLQSYSHFSRLLPSKPQQHSAHTRALGMVRLIIAASLLQLWGSSLWLDYVGRGRRRKWGSANGRVDWQYADWLIETYRCRGGLQNGTLKKILFTHYV